MDTLFADSAFDRIPALETFTKRTDEASCARLIEAAKKADFLRQCTERPRHCRAAQKLDELAPPHPRPRGLERASYRPKLP
jgi:hypothetical protein